LEPSSKDEYREEGRGSYNYWTETKRTKTPNTTFSDKTLDIFPIPNFLPNTKKEMLRELLVQTHRSLGDNKLTLGTGKLGSNAWRFIDLKRHSIF
jgi:hypothetical protein